MAKLTGPLASVSASGTIGGLATYRATRQGAVAQSPPRPTGSPSHAQDAERARFRAALQAWNAATDDTRAEWTAVAASSSRPPHMFWTREWMLQHCQPGETPLCPTAPGE